jgi:peptidoglycan/xylan/chitin deacetylase (PgdA/CDA1 family)
VKAQAKLTKEQVALAALIASACDRAADDLSAMPEAVAKAPAQPDAAAHPAGPSAAELEPAPQPAAAAATNEPAAAAASEPAPAGHTASDAAASPANGAAEQGAQASAKSTAAESPAAASNVATKESTAEPGAAQAKADSAQGGGQAPSSAAAAASPLPAGAPELQPATPAVSGAHAEHAAKTASIPAAAGAGPAKDAASADHAGKTAAEPERTQASFAGMPETPGSDAVPPAQAAEPQPVAVGAAAPGPRTGGTADAAGAPDAHAAKSTGKRNAGGKEEAGEAAVEPERQQDSFAEMPETPGTGAVQPAQKADAPPPITTEVVRDNAAAPQMAPAGGTETEDKAPPEPKAAPQSAAPSTAAAGTKPTGPGERENAPGNEPAAAAPTPPPVDAALAKPVLSPLDQLAQASRDRAAKAPATDSAAAQHRQAADDAAQQILKVLDYTGLSAPAKEPVPPESGAKAPGAVEEPVPAPAAAAVDAVGQTAPGEDSAASGRSLQPGSRSEPPKERQVEKRRTRPRPGKRDSAPSDEQRAPEGQEEGGGTGQEPGAAPDAATPGTAPAAEPDAAAKPTEAQPDLALHETAAAAAESVMGNTPDTTAHAETAVVDELASAPADSSSIPASAPAPEKPVDFMAPFVPHDAGTTLAQLESGDFTQPKAATAAALAASASGLEPALRPEVAPMFEEHAGGMVQLLADSPPLELALGTFEPPYRAYNVPQSVRELSRGNPKLKQVALTFDDGPHPEFTSQILAVLRFYDVPATFFFTGIQAQKYPNWVRMAHQAGHEIGNHTYDHFRIPKLPRPEQEYQIDEYQRLIKGLTGVAPRFLRPPGGQLDAQAAQLAAQRGLAVALWDVNLNDVRAGKSAHELLKTSLKKIRPGSVILAHDGIQSTIDMLPELIITLRAEGYRFVTLSELASGVK